MDPVRKEKKRQDRSHLLVDTEECVGFCEPCDWMWGFCTEKKFSQFPEQTVNADFSTVSDELISTLKDFDIEQLGFVPINDTEPYVIPNIGPKAMGTSLHVHAALKKKALDDAPLLHPQKQAWAEKMAQNDMEVNHARCKFEPPDMRFTYDQFKELVEDQVDMQSGPGWPHLKKHAQNGPFFGYSTVTGDRKSVV